MKTIIFHTDDSEITTDILRKKYPDSKIQIISSGGTKMGTKKSSKAVASKKPRIDGATEQTNVSAKTQVAKKSISKEAEKIPGGKLKRRLKKDRGEDLTKNQKKVSSRTITTK